MRENRKTLQKPFRLQDSLSYRLIIKISVVFCAVFLLLFFTILGINYRLIVNEEKQMFHSYETHALLSVDDKLKDMCRVSLMSMADEKTMDAICRYDGMSTYEQIKTEEQLRSFYGSLIAIREDISGIYLLDLHSMIFHLVPYHAAVQAYGDGEIQERISGFAMEPMKIANCSFAIEKQPFFMRFSGEYETNPYLNNCIWMIRDIYTFSPHEKVGSILLTAPVKTLRDLCLETLGEDMIYLLTTADGKIVCAEDPSLILQKASDQFPEIMDIEEGEGEGENGRFVSLNGERYLISRTQSEASGLVLYAGRPASCISGKIFRFLKYYLLLSAAALAAAILLTAGYVRRIIRPITYLADEMQHFDKTKLSVRYPVTSHDETGRLINAFNEMMDMISDLIEKEYLSQMQIKESKLTEQRLMMLYLKSQVNPHFLYNTLDTIRISAQLGQNEVVAEMLMQLVNFFRLSAKQNEPVVTLEHEMELLKAYLKLMQFRYPDFAYEIDLPEDLMETEIPNFVLQPVVENSLQHGLANKGYRGHIFISVGRCEEDAHLLRISIEDDGIGFTEETRRQVQRLLDLDEEHSLNQKEKESIGIRNVQSRLRLFYPDLQGLEYRNSPGGGIIALICIWDRITYPEGIRIGGNEKETL